METLYIVIYRYNKNARWQPKTDGCFGDRNIAEGFKLALENINPEWEYAIVEGPICSPADMAEAERLLGTFTPGPVAA